MEYGVDSATFEWWQLCSIFHLVGIEVSNGTHGSWIDCLYFFFREAVGLEQITEAIHIDEQVAEDKSPATADVIHDGSNQTGYVDIKKCFVLIDGTHYQELLVAVGDEVIYALSVYGRCCR
jgi:hypothetical protein